MTLQNVNDDFNRSDRWLGASSEPWVAASTTNPNIKGNQVEAGPTNTGIVIHTSSFSGPQVSQMTLKTIGSATSKAAVYAAVRNNGTTPGNTYDWDGTDAGDQQYRWLGQTSNYKLQRHEGSTGWTTITGTTYTSAPAINDVIKITWDPATGILKGFLNGVERATYTDPSPISDTHTRIGFMLQSGSACDTWSGSWDVSASPAYTWHEWTGGTAPTGSEITLTVDGEWNGATVPNLNDLATSEVATDNSTLPLAQPNWSEHIRDGFGINCHYKFSGSSGNVHFQVAQLTAYIIELDCGWVRDRLVSPGITAYTNQWAQFPILQNAGIGQHFTLSLGNDANGVPQWEFTTQADVDRYWSDMAAHPTWRLTVGGPNEPDDLPQITNWPNKLVTLQQKIFSARAASGMTQVPIASPSLKDGQTVIEQSYVDLGATTIWQLLDYADYHRYPMGKNANDPEWNATHPYVDPGTNHRTPSFLQQQRIDWAKAAYKTDVVMCTEGGYNTNLNVTVGGEHVPDDIDSYYKERHLFELLNRGVKRWFLYELMDDPDPTIPPGLAEAHRGLIFTPTLSVASWTRKPAFNRMKALMALVKNVGGGYDPVTNPFVPPQIRFETVCSDPQFRYYLAAKRDGTVLFFYWLDKALWNVGTNQVMTPTTAAVTVETTVGGLINLTATGVVQSVVLV